MFFFKQKTAYEMRISDWSSDVCSSDLLHRHVSRALLERQVARPRVARIGEEGALVDIEVEVDRIERDDPRQDGLVRRDEIADGDEVAVDAAADRRPDLGVLEEIGRAHVWTPVTNAHLVCRLLLEKKNKK